MSWQPGKQDILVVRLFDLAVCEGERLEFFAETDFELPALNLVACHNLVEGGRAADRYRRGLPVPDHRDGALAAGHDVDVLGVVVQLDAGRVGTGCDALVVQRPGASEG